MNENHTVTRDLLCAFLDNELDELDQASVVEALRQDKELAAQYAEMVHLKNMINVAYRNPPAPRRRSDGRTPRMVVTARAAALAGLMISLGGFGGWIAGSQYAQSDGTYTVQSVAQLDPLALKSDKVLIHINTADAHVVRTLLDKTELLLEQSQLHKRPVQVEVVANANGLHVLRDGSIFAERIRALHTRFDNISFLACGIARRNASEREGREIELLPDAREIPAAMDEIFQRTQSGWTYIRT